jgi:hypothetical protein
MTAGAAFYFNMVGFNKEAITPDFAAKHVSYILNRHKVCEVGSQHAPADYVAAQGWLTQQVLTGRKNARVWTRFILNLPYDLSHPERVQLVKVYLGHLSQGRAPFLWAIHDDTRAPHAHVVFVDRDVRTKRRVAKVSDAGSAYRLRTLWEDCCNQALALAGSTARISRWGKRSLHHQQLNERARSRPGLASSAVEPVGFVATADRSATIRPQSPPAPGLTAALEKPHAVEHMETEMDAVIKQDVAAPSISAGSGGLCCQPNAGASAFAGGAPDHCRLSG